MITEVGPFLIVLSSISENAWKHRGNMGHSITEHPRHPLPRFNQHCPSLRLFSNTWYREAWSWKHLEEMYMHPYLSELHKPPSLNPRGNVTSQK